MPSTTVSLSLGGADNGTGSGLGTFQLSLNGDAGGVPGSVLTMLINSDGISSPLAAGIYNFLPQTSNTVLSANTRYWVVATSPDSGIGTDYRWNMTSLTNLNAGSVWSLGARAFTSVGNWNLASGYFFEFSVSVASNTAPMLNISQPIVLTYTNAGTPYVLQRNSNSATTNWVNVTNAILSGTLSNQTVFILPPNAWQMFYRLSL